MECDHADFQQPLDEVEVEVVVVTSSILAVALVMVIEIRESVVLAPTALLKADCPDRTTHPALASTMAQGYVEVVPRLLVRWLSCNPEKAFCMQQASVSVAEG